MTTTPLWSSIASTLRDEISAGLYRPGDRLPTESALARRFGVNRHTVRHALSGLVKDGTITTRRGAGAFVSRAPTDYPLGRRVRFHQNLAAAGRLPEKRFLHIETRAADSDEAEALSLAQNAPVHRVEGVSFADGLPIAHFISTFPAARLPDLPAHLQATGSVTQALAACGITDYTRASTRLSARRATALQARHLMLREGDPILFSFSINIDPAGQPVELGQTAFIGDHVTLSILPEA
ncbi:phosphonate metabolism transcriptional regulator PhnF [Seohaeicola sp. SP36]|jgi:GntR family phosphonate transport system transcriptional regulator|uniref:phosphonate metabolism transcriptional regulator PhnF n=1 Tax=unclassified Seohaeicola TaxID=2641111 RepID=UPI00237A87E2|nr:MULTISPECIES: phosphonate metabolism transcriptional regulator PhnF [unclassified Seohaeicola]MDD9709265.1 phosphonate metabolism transcriptional regulator PhnF [Seohaeicola sp. 4SK31]MDD9737471.1 phosphonate metabolism transcriptional regulator PhnF [Seohaeicola sp. SP36]